MNDKERVYLQALLDAIEQGSAVATSQETVAGIPTIHQFRGSVHHGFGCFSAKVEGKNARGPGHRVSRAACNGGEGN